MAKLLEPPTREEAQETVLIKWWRGWYRLGWRGQIAKWLLAKELNRF